MHKLFSLSLLIFAAPHLIRTLRRGYFAAVSWADFLIGELLDAVDTAGAPCVVALMVSGLPASHCQSVDLISDLYSLPGRSWMAARSVAFSLMLRRGNESHLMLPVRCVLVCHR